MDKEKEAKEALKNNKIDQSVLLELCTAEIDGTKRWVALGKKQNDFRPMYLLKTLTEPNKDEEFSGLPIGYVYNKKPFVFSDVTNKRLDTFLTAQAKVVAKKPEAAAQAQAKPAAAQAQAKPAAAQANEGNYRKLLDDLAKKPQSLDTVNEFVEIYNIHNTSAEYLEASTKGRKNPQLNVDGEKLELLRNKVEIFKSIKEFKDPDLFKLQTISGNNFDCFFHAFLFCCSDLFRNLSLACKNLIASYFRRTYTRNCYDNYLLKNPINFTLPSAKDDYEKMLKTWSAVHVYIKDDIIQKIVNMFLVNLLILDKTMNLDGLWSTFDPIKTSRPSRQTIMLCNPGNSHFEVIYKYEDGKKKYVFLNVYAQCVEVIQNFLSGGRRKKSKVTTKKKQNKKGLRVTKRKKPFRRIKLGQA